MAVTKDQRMIVGIVAIVIGSLGIHKFMMGKTNAGIIQIVASLCFGIGSLIALIEGIIYLLDNDDRWYNERVIGPKAWF
jgi:TM2 domain-containing membrane protein YozV